MGTEIGSAGTIDLPTKDRMIRPDDLQWGQTPFDNLTRAELLRLVQAYHSALMDVTWPLQLMRHGREQQPFWQFGPGKSAFDKLEILRELSGQNDDAGYAASHAFFRYADDLLFPGLDVPWKIYPDGRLLNPGFPADEGRPLTWADLLPATDSPVTK